MLIGDSVNKETHANIINQQKLVKNPNWQKADQLTIYKACRSCIWGHRRQIHPVAGRTEMNPGPPAYKSSALTTRPCSLPLRKSYNEGTGFSMHVFCHMAAGHVTMVSSFEFTFWLEESFAKLPQRWGKIYLDSTYSRLLCFGPLAGSWAHHKGLRRLKPCQLFLQTVYWHCDCDSDQVKLVGGRSFPLKEESNFPKCRVVRFLLVRCLLEVADKKELHGLLFDLQNFPLGLWGERAVL